MDEFNTNALIDPIEFYNVIYNNFSKFSDKDKFIITRFFDKLADSTEFAYLCKYKLKVHINKKDIKSRADEIFNSKDTFTISVLDGISKLERTSDKWEFSIGSDVFLDELSDNEAFKIVKDINNAFLIKYNREKEGS